MADQKLGHVKLVLDSQTVSPGQNIKLNLAFQPSGFVHVNNIIAKLSGKEICVSGSGTNRTTHRHVICEEPTAICSQKEVEPEEYVELEAEVQIPQTDAYSFSASSNDIVWELSVRIDIPRYPDWKRTYTINMIP